MWNDRLAKENSIKREVHKLDDLSELCCHLNQTAGLAREVGDIGVRKALICSVQYRLSLVQTRLDCILHEAGLSPRAEIEIREMYAQ